MSVARRARLALGLFAISAGLMIVFAAAAARAVGVVGLVASLVVGGSAIITHEALSDHDPDPDPAPAEPPPAFESPEPPLP